MTNPNSQPAHEGSEPGSLLVVGSVALDHVRTPAGVADESLGGAATFFSVAATILHRPVYLVGVVGEDFPEEVIEMLSGRGIDCSGLDRREGRTFRWKGYYEGDMNEAVTEETHLNVFGDFVPNLSSKFRQADYVFLANIDPTLQLKVLDQIEKPRIVGADTMNFWIQSKTDELREVISRVDLMVLNDAEAILLTGETNLVRAAEKVLEMGPDIVAVKKGAHGALVLGRDDRVLVPAVPLSEIVDPTGAGDSFAGGMMASLANQNAELGNFDALRTAVGYGSVIASFNCESFSIERLKELQVPMIEERLQALRNYSTF